MFIESYILRMLDALSSLGTMSRAGEKIGVSQPAITKAMKKIEDELGVSLFDRTKNSISLNENGKLAAEYASKIMALQNEMIKAVQEKAGVHRSFCVGSVAIQPAVELTRLADELYAGANASYSIETDESKLLSRLKNEEYQMLVLLQPLKAEGIACERYFTEHLSVTLPKTHRLSGKKELSLSELKGEQFAFYSDTGFWEKLLKEKIPDSKWVRLIHDDNHDPITAIMESSDMASFISNRTLWFSLPKNRISIPITDRDVHPTFWCVFKKKDEDAYKKILEAIKRENN